MDGAGRGRNPRTENGITGMTDDSRNEKRVAGVKARHLQNARTGHHAHGGGDAPRFPAILIVSPWHRRVAVILTDILNRSRKNLECAGVDLYRQAMARLTGDLQQRVVALVITDQPDDCHSAGESGSPMWKESIHRFREDYLASWAEDIEKERLPANLTVITYFRTKKGKLSLEEIEAIEGEFGEFAEAAGLNHKPCMDDEELRRFVDKDVVDMVLKRQHQMDKVKTLTRSREQKIARAKKVTNEARWKM